MRLLGNLIWFILAGFWSWLAWTCVGILFCMTIIGIPFGLQFFKIARFGLFPFGRNIVPSPRTSSLLLNIIWIVFFGWELALGHLASAFLLCLSIIGIPFAIQSVKLAGLSLFPFGAEFE